MARQSLGRGLSALLGEDTNTAERAVEAGIDQLEPNSEQPRTRFEEAALVDLARSIEANGIVQPIVVRKRGARFQIVAGERRWRAAQRAGLRSVPIVVREVSDEKLLELALVENIQRAELNPVEEAKAYRKLIDTIGLTQEQVSERVGRERSLVATSLRLLKLPADIQTLMEEGKLSAGHGRALLLAEDPAQQRKLARSIIEKGWSVRETEAAAKRERPRVSIINKGISVHKDPNLTAAEASLRRHLGTNVKIVPGPKGGKIEVEYYNDLDLDRIYNIILKS